MTTILAPTDFSENAANALQYAASVANFLKARLILLHIVNLPEPATELGFILPDKDPLEKAACETRITNLARQIQAEHNQIREVSTICRYDYHFENLNEIIRDHRTDLVIMGTKGASNLIDKLMGATTLAVIKLAECPVLAGPAQARFTSIKKITYATDLETDQTIFLKQLFQFAEPFQAEVALLNVKKHAENTETEEKCIQEIITGFTYTKYALIQVEESSIPAGIETYASANQTDILAISIHPHSVLESLFHTSISKQLVYHTSVPVLALPEKPYRSPHPTGTTNQIKKQLFNKHEPPCPE